MGKKLPPKQSEFYKRIDEILFYKWDSKAVSEKDKLKQKIKNNSSKIEQKAKGIEAAIKARNQKRS